MNFTVLSLFPQILAGFFETSIMAKSIAKGLIDYRLINIRDFAEDKHRVCDDAPYGGGPGMVMRPEPLALALESVRQPQKRVIYLTPSGRLFNQSIAAELARQPALILVCGRYEGIDQRIIDEYVDDEISIGDYVLSSGETAALVVIDAVYRLIDGVINQASLADESHVNGWLEYPQYTRPQIFHGRSVPAVLLSGDHAQIAAWRQASSQKKTACFRQDLLDRQPGFTKP